MHDLRKPRALNIALRTRACALLFAAPALGAQSPAPALQKLSLDAKKLEGIERGDALAITLDSPEKTEIAMLGVVRLEVPRAFYIDHVHALTGFLSGTMKASSGGFSDPATVGDVANLSFDPSDAKALAKCRLFDCDVKLPAAEMEKIRDALAKALSPAAHADSMLREWIVDYVNAYRADSTGELTVYDDTRHSVRGSDAYRALVTEPMPPGIDPEPFAQLLALPRSARPAGSSSKISWEMDRLPGLKPTAQVVERAIYTSPIHADESWLVSKQLYASHYFEAQVDLMTASDAPAPSGKSATYLIVLRRIKFDDLPSGGLFNIKGKAVKKLRDALRSSLASTRADMWASYSTVAAPPEPVRTP